MRGLTTLPGLDWKGAWPLTTLPGLDWKVHYQVSIGRVAGLAWKGGLTTLPGLIWKGGLITLPGLDWKGTWPDYITRSRLEGCVA